MHQTSSPLETLLCAIDGGVFDEASRESADHCPAFFIGHVIIHSRNDVFHNDAIDCGDGAPTDIVRAPASGRHRRAQFVGG